MALYMVRVRVRVWVRVRVTCLPQQHPGIGEGTFTLREMTKSTLKQLEYVILVRGV
jgi:hypothetical protein